MRTVIGLHDPRRGLELDGHPAPAGGLLLRLEGHLDNEAEIRCAVGGRSPREPIESVLAIGLAREGGELLARLRGEFSLLWWDGERRRGILARDQLGVRPLYIKGSGRVLRFASELRRLLDLLPSVPAPDPEGIAQWLACGRQSRDGTVYAGIDRVGPGEMITFGPDGWRRSRYWQATYGEPFSAPREELVERLREAMRTAVERRLDHAGPTAVTLSGGLDSASVAALAGDRALACSATFPDHEPADEAALIATLRDELGISGPVAEVRAGGLLDCAVRHATTWRAPQRGWGEFWMGPLMRAGAEAGATRVLGGDGGDEVFGPRGYLLADALRAGHTGEARRLVRRFPGGAKASRRTKGETIARFGLLGSLPPLPFAAGRRLEVVSYPRWLRPPVAAALRRGGGFEDWKRLAGPRWWAHAAHTVTVTIERVGVCEHIGLTARSSGLEARHPLLDLDLIETSLRLPPGAGLDPRFTRPLVREAMGGLLPDAVRLRPGKARFEPLIIASLEGPDRKEIEALLTGPEAAVGEYVDRERMAADLFGRRRDSDLTRFYWMLQVWRLLSVEVWLRSLREAPAALSPTSIPATVAIRA